jgi:PST family polysaccharide transporter
MSDKKQKEQSHSIGAQAVTAVKWAFVTQVLAKLISPITTLVLAHILSPESFGVVATVTMVVAFATMFSDAGFQKYLIQHEFDSEEELHLSSNVAFWTNFAFACSIWLIVGIFQEELAELVGNPGLGHVLVIACSSLPLVSLSSVQTAIYQRKFDFKTLFPSQIGSAFVVLLVAVPLALLSFGYWSLVISTIMSNLFLALWLTLKSTWKPKPVYSFQMLRQMFSFSAWTLLDAFVIWLTTWAGTFVLGTVMNAYYLGLYKTSEALVAGIISLATASISPILFSSLSRFQSDRKRYDALFYRIQQYLALVVAPLALSLLVFRDFVVGVLLGEQWLETSLFFGLHAAMRAMSIVFAQLASTAYRSLGRPKLALFTQTAYLIILVPTFYLGAIAGYEVFSITVPLVRAVALLSIHFIACKIALRLSPLHMLRNQRWIYLNALLTAALCCLLLLVSSAYWYQALVLCVGVAVYIALTFFVRETRGVALTLIDRFGLSRYLGKVVSAVVRKK